MKKYPDLFSGEKNVDKLFFTIRFIVKKHHSRRTILLDKIRGPSTQSANAETEGEILDLVRKSLMLTYTSRDVQDIFQVYDLGLFV